MNTPIHEPEPDTDALDEATLLVLKGLCDAPPLSDVGIDSLRQRLFARVASSVRAASAFHTVRGSAAWQVAGLMRERVLYRHAGHGPVRAGEPLRARQIELAAGAHCALSDVEWGVRCEWLVMAGDASVNAQALALCDYRVTFADGRPIVLSSAAGAVLYLREAACEEPGALPHTVPAAQAPWSAYAPGIERRVIWQRGLEAAMLYRVQPGATVPGHGHGHDEECLMLDGEVFVDDILLRRGEYQLAPAGSRHGGVSSDCGGLLFAHGDIELAI